MKNFISLCLLVVVVSSATASNGGCPRYCNNQSPRIPCPFGIDPGFCGCGPITCLKGPGHRCGGVGGHFGKCQDRFFCDKSYSQTNGYDNPVGVCRPKMISQCFPPCYLMTCDPVYNCPHGIGKDFCGCCDVCLQGPGEYCGREFSCGHGMYCDSRPGADDSQGFCRRFVYRPTPPIYSRHSRRPYF